MERIHSGRRNEGKKIPVMNDIGQAMALAMPAAALCVFVIPEKSKPKEVVLSAAITSMRITDGGKIISSLKTTMKDRMMRSEEIS